MTIGRCTFCFSLDGKTFDDARIQANETAEPVIFFVDKLRYVAFPNDPKKYEYTTKSDVFFIHLKKTETYLTANEINIENLRNE